MKSKERKVTITCTEKQLTMLEMDDNTNVTAKELEDAINLSYGTFSLDFNHDDIIVAKARKIKTKK